MADETYLVLVRKRRAGEPAEVPPEKLSRVVEDYPDKILAEVTATQHQELLDLGYMVEDLRDRTKIRVGTLAIDPATPDEAAAAIASAEDEEGTEPEYYFIQFIGPVKQEWVEGLNQANLTPLTYYHDFTYLVHGKLSDVEEMAKNSYVRAFIPYGASVKLTAEAKSQLADEDDQAAQEFWVLIFTTGSDVQRTIQRLIELRVEILEEKEESRGFYQRVHIRALMSVLNEIARIPGIYNIEPFHPIVAEDEVAGQIVAGNLNAMNQPQVGYQNWLNQVGINGAGVTIGINEAGGGGIDPNHPAFTGRLAQITGTADAHGTMVAGQAAGNYITPQVPDMAANLVDANGFLFGIGIAPAANLLSQSSNAPDSARDCVTNAGLNGVNGSIINNSWGAGTATPMDYQADERAWDEDVRDADPNTAGNTPLVVCFSAGNSGNAGLTRPKASKNTIVTGNFENFRPQQFGTNADNVNERWPSSSIGNCADGRIKPDIVTPGHQTASAAFPQPSTGANAISFWLFYGDGTSAASPKTAGACALIVQWWLQRYRLNGIQRTLPSPAMAKAMLINGAVDTGAGGPIPNPQQGWGRVNLNNTFNPGVPIIRVSQKHLLQPASVDVVFDLMVADPNRPLRITLVWTDVPGTVNSGTAGNPALVNALGLQVTQGATIWFGNNFTNGFSQAGGVQDAIQNANPSQIVNNVQNVFIQNHPAGNNYRLRITPNNIVGDCLTPANPFATPANFRQDFALVIQNARLMAISVRHVAELCLNKTGPLSLKNDIFDSQQSGPFSLRERLELILSAC